MRLPPVATPLPAADWLAGLVPGRATPQFQAALATYLGQPVGLLASSGRAALYLLLDALRRLHPGRTTVLLPAYTCPSLVKVILDVGLRPELLEMESGGFGVAPGRVEAQLSPSTLALIWVHPFGLPQPMAGVQQAVRQAGALLIEDAAQAMGAVIESRPVGTLGDFGLFSLGPGKSLSLGGGGFVTVNNQLYQEAIRQQERELAPAPNVIPLARLLALGLVFHPAGWGLATRLGLHRVGDQENSWGYRLTRLSEAQAAIGLRLLPKLDGFNRRRRENGRAILALSGRELPPQDLAVYLRLPIRSSKREALYGRLWAAGIGVGRLYGRPLNQIFPHLTNQTYPQAQQLADQLLTLPTHHYLTPTAIEKIAALINLS